MTVSCPFCHATTSFQCDVVPHNIATTKCTTCSTELQFDAPKTPVDIRCYSCGNTTRYTPPPQVNQPVAQPPVNQPGALPVAQPPMTQPPMAQPPITTTVVVREEVPVVVPILSSYGYYGGGYWVTPFGWGYYGPTWRPWFGMYMGGPCSWYGPGYYRGGGWQRPHSPGWRHSYGNHPGMHEMRGPHPAIHSTQPVHSVPHTGGFIGGGHSGGHFGGHSGGGHSGGGHSR